MRTARFAVLRIDRVYIMTKRPSAMVYIDGFNLYRRSLDRFPEFKWLDLVEMCRDLLGDHEVKHVHYFTAMVKAGAGDDPASPSRQDAYIRALKATGNITVHLGQFRLDRRSMPMHPATFEDDGSLKRVMVRKTEEKGSDVNLAVRMMLDASRGSADLYCLLTNDSDQVTTITTLQTEMGAAVGWISPLPSLRSSKELTQTRPARVEVITPELLKRNQLPNVVIDGKRKVHRPEKWTKSEGPSGEPGPSNQ